MKTIQYLLLATVCAATSLQAADCGCNKKMRPPKDVAQENDVTIMNVGGFAKKDRRTAKASDDVALVAINNTEERVQRKPLPADREQAIYQRMAKLADNNRKFVGGKNAPQSPSDAKLHTRGCNIFGTKASYPVLTHFVRETDPQGSIVTIQDGSVWRVSESDQDIVKGWTVHSELTIKPNSLSIWNKLTGTKPRYKFRIVNLASNQSVEANMSLGPFKYNPNTRKIDRIDYSRGEVYLNNGSIWKIDMSGPCVDLLRDWQKGHAVILGTNDTWFSLGSPHIIIDVEKDNWVPATRVF